MVDEQHPTAHTETAVLAGGCFWGVQTTFERIKGVEKTWAGYSGGTKETANYGAVSSETTGHAESVKVVFDPAEDQLWDAAAGVLHGGGGPDAVEPAGAGCGDFVSVGDFLYDAGAGEDCEGVYRATGCGEGVSRSRL